MQSSLIMLIIRHSPKLLTLAILLNLLTAGLSIGVIAFVNHKFLGELAMSWQLFGLFLGLIGLLLVIGFAAQFVLTYLGHRFVYQLRKTLLVYLFNMPFERFEQIGKEPLLASLSTDITTLNHAFVRLPELVQGVVLVIVASVYMAYLSLPLFGVMLLWTVMVVGMGLALVGRVYEFLDKQRALYDKLYQDYERILMGKKELSFSVKRTHDEWRRIDEHSKAFYGVSMRVDSYHLSAVNFWHIMMFAGIGVVLAAYLGQLADRQTAITAALVSLFLQAPLLKAVGAYPVYQSAKVALAKIYMLGVVSFCRDGDTIDYLQGTSHQGAFANWQSLALQQIGYGYDDGQFAISHIDLTIYQGETLFLVGDNGSGKSTLAKVITALYRPTQGQICVDGVAIDDTNVAYYQQLFAPIFSDVYVFDVILGNDEALIDTWLHLLGIKDKLVIDNGVIQNMNLSTGQKKRVALLLAVTENKPILLLDEWAADQDPNYREYFYKQLLGVLKAMGKTVLVISHDDRFFDCADRVLLMSGGRLVERG